MICVAYLISVDFWKNCVNADVGDSGGMRLLFIYELAK